LSVAQSVRRTARVTFTLTILVAAAFAGLGIWNHYLVGPWTRDGQVQADVVSLAPEVSGQIVALRVHDNQTVHRGDVLYEIDPTDYQVALANAQANVQSREADYKVKQEQAGRRAELTTLTTSKEEEQVYRSGAAVAQAAYVQAQTQLSQASIDIGRTKVLSPVNGYITNLLLRTGDYATKGGRNISVLDSDSFWVAAYFEETKLSGIHIGDPALVALMGFRDPVRGHVESIARGIDTPNANPGTLGLATVSPVFTWVRLAQRIPVRIHIDGVPPSVTLAAGLTATVTVGADARPDSNHGLLSRLVSDIGG